MKYTKTEEMIIMQGLVLLMNEPTMTQEWKRIAQSVYTRMANNQKNNDEFKPQFSYCIGQWGGYELEVSRDGGSARVRYTYQKKDGVFYSKHPRWQEIKFTAKGEPFVTYDGRKLMLDNFIRNN